MQRLPLAIGTVTHRCESEAREVERVESIKLLT